MSSSAEHISLAPLVVFRKAKLLAERGLYELALKLLQENEISVTVYTDHLEMKIPTTRKRQYYFEKQPPV